AASGIINTSRQLGTVVGSAAVGALLQNRLATELTAAGARNASKLPAAYRGRFLDGLRHASEQTGARLPSTVPAQVRQVFADTFHEALVHAMRTSLVLPVALLVVAALSCLIVPGRRRAAAPAEVAVPAAVAVPTAAVPVAVAPPTGQLTAVIRATVPSRAVGRASVRVVGRAHVRAIGRAAVPVVTRLVAAYPTLYFSAST